MRAQRAPIAAAHSNTQTSPNQPPITDADETTGRPFTAEEHAQSEGVHWDRIHKQSFAEAYPGTKAGAPIPNAPEGTGTYEYMRQHLDASHVNIWAPFQSKLDWCMAYWAKTRGPSSTAIDELFGMEDVRTIYCLELSIL